MQTITKIKLILLFCILGYTIQAQSLRVQDPRQGSRNAIGQIDSAAMTIKPQGIYAEVGLYLTYSSKNTNLTGIKDTLEVQHYFNLPKDVLVSDSWLWFQDIIIKAKIIDRWTASTIYNNIVGRRQDPSLLLKNSATNYEFRIYPMAGNQTRRVKLTFLIPMRWQNNRAIVELPSSLLTVSGTIPKLNVRIFENSAWKNPKILEIPSLNLTQQTDSLGTSLGAWVDIAASTTFGKLTLAYDSPTKNGLYCARYPVNNNEGFYQLVMYPNQIANITNSTKNLLVAIDYNIGNTSTPKATILSQVKENLKATLGEKDSFNLILSKPNPNPLSNKWLKASLVDSVFESLASDALSNISNLQTVLSRSLEFLKTNSSGSLILLSSDASYTNTAVSNELIIELKKIIMPIPKMSILDFSNTAHQSFWVNGIWYTGNNYLYTNLSRQSAGGTLLDAGSFFDVSPYTRQLFQKTNGVYDNLDLYTTLEDGYCHSRYNLEDNNKDFGRPIIQVGRYRGQFPFRIEVSGSYNNLDFSKKMTIPESEIALSANTLPYFWAGQEILKLENTNLFDNATIQQIINVSMPNRILSRYTAFLALEPSLGGDTCRTCDLNRTIATVSTKEISNTSLKLTASPNPFKTTTTFKITFDAWSGSEKAQIIVYDLTGKIVKTLLVTIKKGDTEAQIELEADTLPAGIYIARFTSDNIQRTLKIVKIE